MKNNQLNVIMAVLLLAITAIQADLSPSDTVQKALSKAFEIAQTGKGSLTKEESAILAVAGISYTTQTTQNTAPAHNVEQNAALKNSAALADHSFSIANSLFNQFDSIFSQFDLICQFCEKLGLKKNSN